MRLRVRGVVVLVGLPRVRRLALEPRRHRIIRARILGIDVGRADDHLGAEGAQRVDLFLRLLVRGGEDALVALDHRGDRQAHAGVARGALDDRAARLQLAGLLGVLDHLHRHAVLDRVAGIGRLDLRVDVGGDDALGNAVEADHRRIADGFEDVVVDSSRHRGGSRCQTIIHGRFWRRWRCSCCWRSRTRGRSRPRRRTGRASMAATRALNTWAVSWVGTHLFHDPPRLFDANIFYPERLTLAYSEAMIVQGLFAAPVLALGGSAVLAYNVSLLAGFALTAWAFCLLVQRWTGSWAAGYVAGSLAAFNAHSLVSSPSAVPAPRVLRADAVCARSRDRLASVSGTRAGSACRLCAAGTDVAVSDGVFRVDACCSHSRRG